MPQAITNVELARIAEYAEEHTYRQAADHFGVSKSTVYRAKKFAEERAHRVSKTTAKVQSIAQVRGAPDLKTLSGMMIQRAERMEQDAARLRAAAELLED